MRADAAGGFRHSFIPSIERIDGRRLPTPPSTRHSVKSDSFMKERLPTGEMTGGWVYPGGLRDSFMTESGNV